MLDKLLEALSVKLVSMQFLNAPLLSKSIGPG